MSKSIAPAPLTDKSMATDIRNALREKKPGERGAFLVGDNVGDDVIAAVAHGPTFLSGLADEVRDAHVKAWSARKYPGEAARLARLSAALDDARTITVKGDKYFSRSQAMAAPETSARVQAAQEAATEAAAAE